jgi:hypothetical protein
MPTEDLITTCSYCPKIKNGKDWKSPEELEKENPNLYNLYQTAKKEDFSHGCCPKCAEKKEKELGV